MQIIALALDGIDGLQSAREIIESLDRSTITRRRTMSGASWTSNLRRNRR